MNFFKYIELGVSGAEVVAAFVALIAAKQQLTGPEVIATVQPLIMTLQSGFNVNLPTALVTDIAAATADAVNKYVFKVTAPTT